MTATPPTFRRGRKKYAPRSPSRHDLSRALQHIEEARQFTRAVGGCDADVKQYFFSLDSHNRDAILSEYGEKYGEDAREYAEETLPRWKSGQTKMSGMVAQRLFSLLPPLMPLPDRLHLVETLWKKHQPPRKIFLLFGPPRPGPTSVTPPDSSAPEDDHSPLRRLVREITTLLQNNFQNPATNSSQNIPDHFKRRFAWLSAGDSAAYEQLLHHYVSLEAKQATAILAATAAVIVRNFGDPQQRSMLTSFSRTAKFGATTITLIYDYRRTAPVISPHDPRITRPTRRTNTPPITPSPSSATDLPSTREGDFYSALGTTIGWIIIILWITYALTR